MTNISEIKKQILSALAHPEAESGLYLNNLLAVHEDEERNQVDGTEEDVLDALKELLSEGLLEMDESGEEVVFYLSSSSQPTLSRKS